LNESPTRPTVEIRQSEVLALVELNLERDDLERAMRWGALALSVNDDYEQPPDADA
jgi:hypothetical protein